MNPFRSPQFENSSKLLSKLETYHLHQTQLSNKPSSGKVIRSPKNHRLSNVRRIEIISGTSDRRQKQYRKKRGARKLILSEKADKAKKKQKMQRKHSDNWTRKSGRPGRDFLFNPNKDKSLRAGKGVSGSPALRVKDVSHRGNYSIGNQKLQMSRLGKKPKWGRDNTFQSHIDFSSDFVHSKENYNMYVNTKKNKVPLVLSKMRKIVKVKPNERSLLESMRVSRRNMPREDQFASHPMVFMTRKTKKKPKSKPSKKSQPPHTPGGSNNPAKRSKKSPKALKLGADKPTRPSQTLRGGPKTRTGGKGSGNAVKKEGASKQGKPRRKMNSSRNAKTEYLMDVFKSMTQKKAHAEKFQSEKTKRTGAGKLPKWVQGDGAKADPVEAFSKRKILEGFLKKTNKMDKILKQMEAAKRSPEDSRALATESSKDKSQLLISKKDSNLEKVQLEDLVDKTNESRQLIQIFQEQKKGIFENKLQIENQLNSVFLKLLSQIEQERVSALRVVEDRFQQQKNAIFEIEKQLVLKDQTMQNLLR